MKKKEFMYSRVQSIYMQKKYEVEEDFINKKTDEKLFAEEVIHFFVSCFPVSYSTVN